MRFTSFFIGNQVLSALTLRLLLRFVFHNLWCLFQHNPQLFARLRVQELRLVEVGALPPILWLLSMRKVLRWQLLAACVAASTLFVVVTAREFLLEVNARHLLIVVVTWHQLSEILLVQAQRWRLVQQIREHILDYRCLVVVWISFLVHKVLLFHRWAFLVFSPQIIDSSFKTQLSFSAMSWT